MCIRDSATVESQHVARDGGEPRALRNLSLRVAGHAFKKRSACDRRLRFPSMHRPGEFSQHKGAMIGFTSEHDSVAPAEGVEHFARVAKTAIDDDR